MPRNNIEDPSKLAKELESIESRGLEEELDQNEIEDLKQEVREQSRAKEDALINLAASLEAQFTKFKSNRSEKENEWVSVLVQYNRKTHTQKEKGKMPSRHPHQNSKPGVNITRSRTTLAIERMQDIQFPLGGDYNFHIDANLNPDVEKQLNSQEPATPEEVPFGSDFDPSQAFPEAVQQQQPPDPAQQQPPAVPTVGEEAQKALNEEQEKAYRMESTIKGQLSATKYGKRARAAMRHWAMLGTAVLKGPVLERRKERFYEHFEDSDGGLQSEVTVELTDVPVVYHVDPRFFYPDTSLDAEDMEKAFELHPLSKKQMIKLSEDPAFMKNKIREVLSNEPDGTSLGSADGLFHGAESEPDFSEKYLVKEYHGPLDKDVLHTLGEITREEKEDDLKEFYGSAWVVQGTIIRVSLPLIDGDDALPYNIAVWEKDDGSIFGHGMPYMMADQQRVVHATWEMLLDNAGLSAGPQIVLNKDQIEPANGKWEMESMKIWYMTEFGGDVRSAFQFVDIPNNQQSLMNVIESAMQFADIESQSPMIQAHTEPQANVPAMNMGMVLTEANVHQRELSQHWDDNMTIPLVNRFIHYNIQYSDDPKIKGNLKASVGGATERIDNQILAQDIERILSMAAQNPQYMLQIKEDEAFRRWVAATRAGPELLRSSEEVEVELRKQEEAAQNAPPDPDTMRAQAVLQREEARQAEMQADLQTKQAELQFKQQNAQLDAQIKQAEMQLKRAELLAKAKEKELELQIAILESERRADIDLAKINKDLEIEESRQELQRTLKAIDLEQFNTEIQVKREEGTGI